MCRKTLQAFVIMVLAVLGAPLAMHVVVHDLQDEHEHSDHHEGRGSSPAIDFAETPNHEHPVVAPASTSVQPPVRATLAIASGTALTPPAPAKARERSLLSVRALRLDDDVGLQALLATFLI